MHKNSEAKRRSFPIWPETIRASGLLILTVASLNGPAAFGQALINTQTGADPRENRQNAANITVEANPEADQGGSRDPERVDDSYQPKGVEFGNFLLLPEVEFEERYNSNVFAQSSDAKGDFITRIAPEVQARSRFKQHALNLSAGAEQYFYRRYTDDNHVDAFVTATGRYDFDRNWEANGLLEARLRHEDRGSPDEAGGEEQTPGYSVTGELGNEQTLGRYKFSQSIRAVRYTFGDVDAGSGGSINNSDRDRVEVVGTGRASYEMFPGYAAIGQLQGNVREYDDTLDDAGVNRSSQGVRAEAGIGVDITQLIRGDFLVGYFRQDYEDPSLTDPSGPAVRAVFNWTPSRMTVVVPSLERSVQETTTTRASGMIRTGGSLLVRHEYARNIVITGVASVYQDDFDGSGQENWTYDGRARLIWALAPEYYVGGELSYRQRTSNVETSEYNQYVLSLRFGLRM